MGDELISNRNLIHKHQSKVLIWLLSISSKYVLLLICWTDVTWYMHYPRLAKCIRSIIHVSGTNVKIPNRIVCRSTFSQQVIGWRSSLGIARVGGRSLLSCSYRGLEFRCLCRLFFMVPHAFCYSMCIGMASPFGIFVNNTSLIKY